MLEIAVTELWEHSMEQGDDPEAKKERSNALSLAIAKVQFVQVYLEDPSIPLPEDEPTDPSASPSATTQVVPERTSSAPPTSSAPQSRPSTSSKPAASNLADTKGAVSPTQPRPGSPPIQQPALTTSSLSPRSRPLLSSSNFSWILGQEAEAESRDTRSAFAKASEHTSFPSDEKRRMRASVGKGYLFGDEEEAAAAGNSRGGSRGSISNRAGKKGKDISLDLEVEEEVIDLEDVGKKGAVS